MAKLDAKGNLMLENVRFSFPNLMNPDRFGRYSVTLILDPENNKSEIALVKKEIDKLIGSEFKGKRIPSDKSCLQDGDNTSREENIGMLVLKAGNKKPVAVFDAKAQVITDEAENPIYSGCYGVVKINLWAQNNDYGKRINATLHAAQFVKNGDALDGFYMSSEDKAEGFEATNDDDADFMDRAS